MQSGSLSAPAWAQRKPRVLEFRSAGKVQRSKESTGQIPLINCSLETENGTERKVCEPRGGMQDSHPFVGGGAQYCHLWCHRERERSAALVQWTRAFCFLFYFVLFFWVMLISTALCYSVPNTSQIGWNINNVKILLRHSIYMPNILQLS